MFYFVRKENCDFLRVVSGADETQIIKFIDSGQHSILISRWTKWFWRKCTIMIHLLLHLSSSPSQSSSSVYQVPLSQTLSHIRTKWNLTKLVLGFCAAVIWNHVITDDTSWPSWLLIWQETRCLNFIQTEDWTQGKSEWFLGFTLLDLSFVPLNSLCL